ncbi:unnamed protein product [Linum tenue]|uniref:F-box domain-containing protein n=1 Tax=Linum tenue TaxID=586396 RepID=A0AAV0J1K8_9ROSI|nr:unnamed protein product [Linum tenue]
MFQIPSMAAYNSNSAPDQPLSLRFLPCSSAKRRRIHSTEGNSLPTKIVQLGDDLLVEILIRLPNPRSACRCKAVCKEWKSLISHPIRFNRRFVSHHQSRNRKSVLLLHSDDPQAIISSFIPMATPFTQRSFEVIDSYKDLVLCGFADVSASCCDSALYGELYRTYFLCNPFTKQWVALPLAPELSIECGHFFTRFSLVLFCQTISGTFAMASAKVDEVPAALCDLKSTITDELLAVAEPIVGLRRVPALVRRAAAFYQRQLIQKLQLLDSGIVANDVQLVSRFPGIDPESVVFKSKCNEASHFLIHCHHDDVTYRAMTVYRVHLMEAVRGFETEVAASDKQLSGSAAQTIQGTFTQPTALQNDVINAADAQGAAAQLIVPQNALLGSAAAEVGNHIAAHNALLDGSVAGGE